MKNTGPILKWELGAEAIKKLLEELDLEK